ncbi:MULTISPECIES: hypothetical protein [Luteimonas]|uniref:hypothetical protein n=1 Tax=Luteimonas TaxID=83614 RepID=UPI00117CAEA0|nr:MULTISPECIES: hypothetical protein [Luteimonas]
MPWATSASAALMRLGVSAAAVFLILGVVLGTRRTVLELTAQAGAQFSTLIGALQGLAAILVAALCLAFAWWLGTRRTPVKPAAFLGLLVLATLVARALLIGMVEPAWSTDYLRYWQRAVEMAAQDQLRVPGIYHQRALLVPYPIVELFGPDATTALKWGNVLMLLVTQLIAYDVMRLVRNHQAAQSTSILMLALPMVAYSALIPSHDLWGLVLFSIAAWSATRVLHLRLGALRLPLFGALTLLCAVSAYCLELQRSIGTLYALVLLIAAIAFFFLCKYSGETYHSASPHGARDLVIVAGVCLLLQFALAEAGTRSGLHATAQPAQSSQLSMKLAAHAGSMGTAQSAWYARFRDRFPTYESASAEDASDFSRSVALSTWVIQPEGKLESMFSHAGRLFDLGYPNDWDTVLRRPEGMSTATRGALLFHISVFGTMFGFALIYALLRLAGARTAPPFPILLGMLFVCALSLMLLAAFENKPSNLFPAWLVYCWIIAWAFSAPTMPGADSPVSATGWRILRSLAAGALVLCVAGLLVWALPKLAYDEDRGLVIDGWDMQIAQKSTPPNAWEQTLLSAQTQAFLPQHYVDDRRSFVLRGADQDGARIHERADRLYTALQLAAPISKGDRISIERALCDVETRNGIEFFLFAPYQRVGVREAFTVTLSVDGQALRRVPIPYRNRRDTMQRIRVDNAIASGMSGDCHTMSITLESNVTRTAMSWQRASYIEIWFPRRVHASK